MALSMSTTQTSFRKSPESVQDDPKEAPKRVEKRSKRSQDASKQAKDAKVLTKHTNKVFVRALYFISPWPKKPVRASNFGP